MDKKIALIVFAFMSITLFLTQFNACSVAFSIKLSVPHDLSYAESRSTSDVDNPKNSIAKILDDAVILNQTFDEEIEIVGEIPKNWTVTQPQYGSFTGDNQTYYSGNASAKFVDNSTVGSPCPYRTFSPQKGTIVVTFVIRLFVSSGNNTNLIIYVDDGNFGGSNINFTEYGTIEYQDDSRSYVLRNYINNTWYRIKMIMNIPNNTYNIYINDLLEARDAKFIKFGTCHEINRIIFGEASFWQPIGYIDDITIRTGIRVPEDYSTIQEAIDAANPGNTICISSSSRPYHENIYFKNKHDLKFIGENKITVTIDGRFGTDGNVVLIDKESYNITISGFTVKNGNVGIQVWGENNTVTDNIILNNKIGVECYGVKNNLTNNRFICNTHQARDYGTMNYTKKRENLWDYNYWSDYAGRDEDGDGIGDTPYSVPFCNVDYYPLFLIKTVNHTPEEPSYEQKVYISVDTLEDVEIDRVILNWTCDSGWKQENMKYSLGKWRGEIGPLPYWPTVPIQYKICARSCCGVWVESRTYSYSIHDGKQPKIEKPVRIPVKVTENEPVIIRVNISEPINASGILGATLHWKANGRQGGIPMEDINRTVVKGNEIVTMEATIPGQPRRFNVTYYIEAFDNAKNSKKSENYSYTVGFASLKTPEILDCMIGEGEIKDFTFSIGNEGISILNWSISIPDGEWKKWIKSVEPKNGSLEGGKNIDVKVTVDATDLAIKSYYYGKLEVASNVGNKSIHILLTVTRIIIDRSLVYDGRCDVNSTQTIYFHAVWAHNSSGVRNCKINVTCLDEETNAMTSVIYTTNATGWISFTNSSLTVGKRTWMVTGVNCGGITSYVQEAPNPSITWEQEQAPFWPQWAFFMMTAVVAAIGGGIVSTMAFWTLRVYKKKS